MPINSHHPKYDDAAENWETMRDTLIGERAIRAKIKRYLPPPPGLASQGNVVNLNEIVSNNWGSQHDRYTFLASFAEFADLTNTTLAAIQGLIHEKPPTIELPSEFEYLLETATPAGDSLEELWEMVTREILAVGRIVLLDEVIGDDLYICPYVAESLINWRVLPKLLGGGPVLAVLEEHEMVPKDGDDFETEDEVTYRELRLEVGEGGDPKYLVRLWAPPSKGADPQPVVIDGGDPEGWIEPQLFGKAFMEMPITVINSITKGFKLGPIPALPMAKRVLNIFRKTADRNRALYIKGDPQAILWGVAEDDVPSFIGGGEIWSFENADGKAEYLDIDGQGIPLMNEAIKEQYDRFSQETGMLVDQEEGAAESGEAIRRRQAGSQVTIKSMVVNAAAAIEAHLRRIARVRRGMDANVDDIVFSPNLDFAEPLMSGKALLDYVMAKNAGAAISHKSIHELARRHKVTEFDFEEELDLIAEEDGLFPDNTPPELMDEPPPEDDDDDEEGKPAEDDVEQDEEDQEDDKG